MAQAGSGGADELKFRFSSSDLQVQICASHSQPFLSVLVGVQNHHARMHPLRPKAISDVCASWIRLTKPSTVMNPPLGSFWHSLVVPLVPGYPFGEENIDKQKKMME